MSPQCHPITTNAVIRTHLHSKGTWLSSQLHWHYCCHYVFFAICFSVSTIFLTAICCLTVSNFCSSTTKIDTGQKYSPSLKNVSAFDLPGADCSCLACLLQSGELGEVIDVTLLRFSAIFVQVICCRFDLWPLVRQPPLVRITFKVHLRHDCSRSWMEFSRI